MEFRIIGPIELWADGVRIDIGPPRQRGVLGALLIEPERPVSLESLVNRVWGDAPPTGVRNVVHTYITRLRRALAQQQGSRSEPVRLIRLPGGYRVETDPGQVDLVRFRRLLAEARHPTLSASRRSALLRQALAAWHGDPLSDLHSEWATGVRQNLRQLHHEALAQLADTEMYLGRPAGVLPDLRTALLADPLAEQLGERLMRALHLDGRSVGALEYYQELRRLIAEELGADPSQRVQDLYEAILRGEPVKAPRTAGGQPLLAVSEDRGGTTPRMLPMDIPDFTGRRRELALAQRLLSADSAPLPHSLLIVGGGGTGKTTLAVHVAHRLSAAFPGGQLFAGLRGSGLHPADPFAVLGRLLRALGLERERIPDDLDERVELYRSRLAGRRALVILDDAADDAQAQPLLPGAPDCAVLVTSRQRLGQPLGATVVPLRELSMAEGGQLLEKIIGAERTGAEPEYAKELVRLCGRLPLAIRAAAARLTSRPHWTLAGFVERMRDESRRLDELAHGSLDVRASLTTSYNSLPSDTREVLRSLAELPVAEFDASVACPVLGRDFAVVEEACEQLVEANLLHVAEGGLAGVRTRYRLQDLQRIYALSLRADPAAH
ncbi:BTAD domain-containing putative transcriptional regulator [Streptomyces sp. NPDC086554]|uniref:AfsR/SARP family transcriptional regulator n=1 Tax=Streptomyces sp. NPDC086554 TaxID=3154864 RepID=UPI0034410C02